MSSGVNIYVDGKYADTIATLSNNEEAILIKDDLESFINNLTEHCSGFEGELRCDEFIKWFEDSELKEDLEEEDYEHIESELGYWEWEADALYELYKICKKNRGRKIEIEIEKPYPDDDCEEEEDEE